MSTAHTAAGLGLKTLVLPGAGELGHPCGGVIAPLPGFITGQRKEDGMHFAELDLIIPSSLVIGHPTVSCYISPGVLTFEASFPGRDDFPIAAIDKPDLLRLMAEKAAAAGAKLRFGAAVTGLLKANGRILGVRTHHGDIHAKVVLSAEGFHASLQKRPGCIRNQPWRSVTPSS